MVSPEEVPGLPDFVRRYRFGAWRRVAPFVHMRPVELPNPGRTRLFLLRSAPGTKMLPHTHTGLEITCILTGAFQQDGSRFGPSTTRAMPTIQREMRCSSPFISFSS